jgi:hypothetical protein
MGSVIIGTNKITNCRILVGLKDQPLLQVEFSPLRVSLNLPQGLPSRVSFDIVNNDIKGEGITPNPDLRIVSGETNVSVFWKDLLLLSATLLDSDNVHLKLDLRPVGIVIYDDHEGLHLGGNLLARSSFANCMTAISLG